MRKAFLVALLASSCGVVPKPQPPPQPLSVQVHVTDTVNSQPIAGASVWAQQTPAVVVTTTADGFATVTAYGSGVCAKKDGFFSPGLPDQPETCKPIASRVELALQPVPPPLPPARRGLVTSSHHALGDADGLRFYLGGTAFWYLGGYTTDRERVVQHAVWWQAHGADYLRLLLHASGSGANAFDPNFRTNFDGLTALLYAHGLRSQATIFGQFNGTAAQRQAVVNTVRDVVKAHPERFMSIEIANEAYANSFPNTEARSYAKQLLAELPHQISVSAPEQDGCDDEVHQGQRTVYAGLTPLSRVLVTLHYSRRTSGDGGLWDPATQPWRGGHQFCLGGDERISDNEGIGPTSSVNQDNDPRRLATTVAVDIIGGGANHVVHVGSGVTGKVDPARNRPANVWEEVNIEAILKAITATRALFPPDAPNWNRGGSKDGPFDAALGTSGTLDRLYCSWSGNTARCAAVNVRKPSVLKARRALTYVAYDVLDGRVLSQGALQQGQSFTLQPDVPGVVVAVQ